MQQDIFLLLLTIFVPIGVGLFLFLIPKKVPFLKEFFTFICVVGAFAGAIRLFLFQNISYNLSLLKIGNIEISIDLLLTPLNGILLILLTGFGLLITLYSFRYRAENSKNKIYYIFLLITVGSGSGVLLSNHLLIFLIFWEFVSVSLYFMINTGTPEAKDGATKTLGMIGASDGCLLLGIVILWYLSNSLTLSNINITIDNGLSYAAYILMMIGAITKAGAMPFHTWIPAASCGAPASVMALLPASIDKLLGIYLLFIMSTKLFVINNIIGMILMIIGAVTIVGAVMLALVQHSLPKLLSYHAISQVGYMVLGIGTMTPIGIIGGLFHMMNHSIYKSCLFLCGGAVEHKTGTNELAEHGGLAGVMPVTFIACLVAALSISGVPPFNGFVSKWMIYQGTIESGDITSLIFLIAAMFGSALTLASFVKVLFSVFLGKKSKTTNKVKKDVEFSMLLPMIILALLCVFIGVFYKYFLNNFLYPGLQFETVFAGVWSSILISCLILLGFVLGFIIYLIGNVSSKSRKVDTFVGGEVLEDEEGRVPGTDFYNTIKAMTPFKELYDKQSQGLFDTYKIFGKVGASVTYMLRALHNGYLSFYLTWGLIGMSILIYLIFYFS